MVTPGNVNPVSSFTVPVIVLDCEKTIMGKKTNSIAELVDLYPSICDLINISKPKHLEGDSFIEALENPLGNYKNTALARYLRGETLIADNYFYTEWRKKGKTIAKMLYDHKIDLD